MSGRLSTPDLAWAVGVRRIGTSGNEIRGSCPLHDDKRRCFSINVKTTKWCCYGGCGKGNDITLVQHVVARRTGRWISGKQAYARLQEGTPLKEVRQGQPYVRTTTRCGGSTEELEPRLALVAWRLQQGWKTPRIVAEQMEVFGDARSTAYTRVEAFSNEHSRRPLRRQRFIAKQVFVRLVNWLIKRGRSTSAHRRMDEKCGQMPSALRGDKRKRAPPRQIVVGKGAKKFFLADVHPLFCPDWNEPRPVAG